MVFLWWVVQDDSASPRPLAPLLTQRYPLRSSNAIHLEWWVVQDSNLRPID